MSLLPVLPSHRQEATSVDAYALSVAKMAMAGTVPEEDAKGFLCSLLVVSTVPLVEARTFLFGKRLAYSQPIADLEVRLIDLLDKKIRSGYISIDKIAAGASFSGAIRMFLRSSFGMNSEWRNLCVQYHHDVPSSHLLAFDGGPMPTNSASTLLLDIAAGTPDEVLNNEVFAATAASFSDRTYTARPMAKLQSAALALNQLHGLPEMAKPATCGQREAVQAEIEAEPKAVYRVAAAMLRGKLVDSPLAELFDNYTSDDLESVCEVDPMVAEMLALAAVSAVPPTGAKVAAELSRQFVKLASSVEQARVAKLVVRTWLDSVSTMLGDEYNAWQWKADEQIAADAAAFAFQVTRLLQTGMSTFMNADQVSSWLTTASDRIAAEQSEATVDTRMKTKDAVRDMTPAA